MSKYTTEVRYICEALAGETESKGYNDVDRIIGLAQSQIFESYPIFDENYRAALNKKILRHFYTNEICAETFGLWKLWLNNTMNEIMPYYNQLYKSALLEFDPFNEMELTTTKTASGSRDNETNMSGVSNTNSTNEYGEIANTSSVSATMSTNEDTTSTNSKSNTSDSSTEKTASKFSDTPQGALNNVEAGDYLTTATINDTGSISNGMTEDTSNGTSTGKATSEGSNNGSSDTNGNSTTQANSSNASTSSSIAKTTDQYVLNIAGKRSTTSYSELLEKFRKTFINIDMMIIKDLDKLFMHLW